MRSNGTENRIGRRLRVLLLCGGVLAGLLAWSAALPAPARADAGGPLLAAIFLDAALFSVGQYWAILVEWIYLRLWVKGLSTLRALWWSFLINSLSAMLGMILLLALLPLFPQMLEDLPSMHETSLHMWLTLGLASSWLLTVVAERWLLGWLARRRGLALERPWKHCINFNALSYAGLIVLALWLLYNL